MVLFAVPAAAGPVSSSSAAVMELLNAVELKQGMTIGADSRVILLYSMQDALSVRAVKQPAAVSPLSYSIYPAQYTFSTAGEISKTFPDMTIAFQEASGNPKFEIAATDVFYLDFSFASPGATPVKTNCYAYAKKSGACATKIDKTPAQMTLTVTPNAGTNTVTLSNITVTYNGPEFLKKFTWNMRAYVQRGREVVALVNFTFDILPGEPVP